jgi:hypothetical protein
MSWEDWNRQAIRAAIEEASGLALSVDDSLPDTLIATAQSLGMLPIELALWIHDRPRPEWTGQALERWARRHSFARDESSPRPAQAQAAAQPARQQPAEPSVSPPCQPAVNGQPPRQSPDKSASGRGEEAPGRTQ